jgi:hypothetical protein
MGIQPTLRDDNGIALTGRGSEIITRRYAGVGTSGQAITLPVDVKEVLVHVEGTSELARVAGTAAGSEQARITSDGKTLGNFPVVKEAGQTVLTVAAPTGTINVSIIAWR